MAKNLKKLTLLHSNDLHGDFLADDVDGKLVGGVSMLSGYIQQVRNTEENVIYSISGDMFRGSLIDSEFQGLSTIDIMNCIAPDVVTLGNHEVDYGLAHLLFMEKCADFPVVNANMYVTTNHKRLFNSHIILERDGMKVLFIGILTEDVLSQTKKDGLIGAIVNIEDAAAEVGKIIDAYQTEDIDFTVLLTHIGFEEDKRLAELLDERWGVDIIIGGHSHTLLEEPAVVKGIPVVQAACGTDQIGRFDIMVDVDNNCIDSYTWQLVPVNPDNCPRDTQLEELISHYKKETDEKYSRIVTRFKDRYTHPARNMETELGKIFVDGLKDQLGVDVMLLGSGSIRGEYLGPIVTLENLKAIFPYSGEVYRLEVTGAQLKTIIRHICRPAAWLDHTEFFQFSRGLLIEFDKEANVLEGLSLNGGEISDEDLITLGVQKFHFQNIETSLGVTLEEVSANKKPKVIATDDCDVLEEYFSSRELVRVSGDRRLTFV